MGLLKQRSWSPDSDREEAWLRRQSINRGRRGRLALTRTRSVTDEDLDELRGCIDLGFGFDADSPLADARRLSDTLPALDLYYAVHRGSPAGSPPSESSSSDGSAASPDLGSPVSFFSAGVVVDLGSLGHRLVGWEPRRSPRARVDLRSLMKLQSFGICCNVSGGVTYPRADELNVALLCGANGTGAGAVAPLDPPSVASPLQCLLVSNRSSDLCGPC
ncbi:hypothetical protein B296_00034832 [Ensete ventricosum]|uniref:Uncharacterized protein n=1 Tax=Ensete ventricosum TaxID=4639 RepID=A0A426ZIM7_ENSVE|nr:hypothetical protein B296_00034832 [Ensete ventricosum]